MTRAWRRALQVGAVTASLAGVTCTVLLDRSQVQCRSDADCVHFGGHPNCRNSVCVRSGLQPDDCIVSTAQDPPSAAGDFLNQCGATNYIPARTGQCQTFDNCRIQGYCGHESDVADAGVMGPPAPDSGTVASPAPTDAGRPVFCQDPTANRGSVVFMTGSSNFPPLLKTLAPTITRLTGYVPVFRTTDSCTGARSMYPDFRLTDHYIHDPAVGSTGAYAQYFDNTGPHDCMVGPAGAEVDIGESEVFAETCGLASPSPQFALQFPGPVLPILFVSSVYSSESTISAEAARQVLGGGSQAHPVPPWTDTTLYFVRGPGTATTLLVARAINVLVPPNRFWGIDQGSAQKLADNLALIVDPEVAQSAIGILGADFYDTNRLNLKALAFRAQGQDCAYTPDSNSNIPELRDKINVRDGHYPLWGTLHFFAEAASSELTSQAATAFLGPFTRNPVSSDLLDAFIGAGWVPDCAMKVQRDGELGAKPLIAYQPVYPCGCYFDTKVSGKPPTGCSACTTGADCPDATRPACNFGFCEAQRN